MHGWDWVGRVTFTWWLARLGCQNVQLGLGRQGDIHMVACSAWLSKCHGWDWVSRVTFTWWLARLQWLGDKNYAMVGTGWASSCPGYMNSLRKRYSHPRGSISGREGCLGSEQVFDNREETAGPLHAC